MVEQEEVEEEEEDQEQQKQQKKQQQQQQQWNHRQGPAWIDAFLSGDYFTSCSKHAGGKNERNHFCTKCSSQGPLCTVGLLPHSAAGHATLQVRKASHMDSIRVVDVARVLEVSDIQTYSINSAKIVFLLSRPQPRPSKGAPHVCLCCRRALPDAVRFCSLACKRDILRDESRNDSITFAMDSTAASATTTAPPDSWEAPAAAAAAAAEAAGERRPSKRRKLPKRRKWSSNKRRPGIFPIFDEDSENDSPATPEKFETSSAVSRRKGVPHRAPLR